MLPFEQTPNARSGQSPMALFTTLSTTLSATLPAPIVETILTRLAGLFLVGAAGDSIAARHAAAQMLAAYHPETEAELSLAAHIVGCSFHALDALGQAAAPDLSLTRVLRLRGSAVSLSRESHKAQRRLDQLQKDRRNGISAPIAAIPLIAAPVTTAQPAQPEIFAEHPRSPAMATEAAAALSARADDQRRQDARIAASLQRAEARVAAAAQAEAESALQADIAAAAMLSHHHVPPIAPAG